MKALQIQIKLNFYYKCFKNNLHYWYFIFFLPQNGVNPILLWHIYYFCYFCYFNCFTWYYHYYYCFVLYLTFHPSWHHPINLYWQIFLAYIFEFLKYVKNSANNHFLQAFWRHGLKWLFWDHINSNFYFESKRFLCKFVFLNWKIFFSREIY